MNKISNIFHRPSPTEIQLEKILTYRKPISIDTRSADQIRRDEIENHYRIRSEMLREAAEEARRIR